MSGIDFESTPIKLTVRTVATAVTVVAITVGTWHMNLFDRHVADFNVAMAADAASDEELKDLVRSNAVQIKVLTQAQTRLEERVNLSVGNAQTNKEALIRIEEQLKELKRITVTR